MVCSKETSSIKGFAVSELNGNFLLTLGDFNLNTTFQFPLTGVTALFGPSGAGKTTLLKCIAGLIKSSGNCYFGSQVWQDNDNRIFIPGHKRKIGFVFQESRLFPHLNVRENLKFGLPKQSSKKNMDRFIVNFNLQKLLSRSIHKLSGGEKQRVALARTLISEPNLLLLDEPLASLDQEAKSELMQSLIKLKKDLNLPIIYVSHSIDEVGKIADRVSLIKNGSIVASGSLNLISKKEVILTGVVNNVDEKANKSTINVNGTIIEVPGLFHMHQKVSVTVSTEKTF